MKAKDSEGSFVYYEDVDIDYFINNFNKINKLCCFFGKKISLKNELLEMKYLLDKKLKKNDSSCSLSIK